MGRRDSGAEEHGMPGLPQVDSYAQPRLINDGGGGPKRPVGSNQQLSHKVDKRGN